MLCCIASNQACFYTWLERLPLIITTIATIVIAYYAYTQAKESSKQRTATILLHLNDIIDKLQESRQLLRSKPYEAYHKDWLNRNTKIGNIAFRASIYAERVAYLARKGLIDKKNIFELYSGLFADLWVQLKEYILKLREESGRKQRVNFELFAKECTIYLNTKANP